MSELSLIQSEDPKYISTERGCKLSSNYEDVKTGSTHKDVGIKDVTNQKGCQTISRDPIVYTNLILH